MIVSAVLSIASVLGLPLAGLVATTTQAALSKTTLESAYAKTEPSVCLLTYTSEVLNTSTGETSRRNRNALALLVSADGLLMAHGHMSLENNKPFNIRIAVGNGDDRIEYDAKILQKPDDVNVSFLRIQSEKKTQPSLRPFRTKPETQSR